MQGEKPKILMTMLEVGFGHKAPAIAVREALDQLYPDRFRIDIIDFAKESGALVIDEQLKRSWDFALAFPASVRIGYLLMELAGENKDYLNLIFKDFVDKGVDYLHKAAPDLIFATHPLCLYIAVKARELFDLKCKIIAYVVDPFDGYAWWADEGADMILVATERSKQRLLKHGISERNIRIIGFPINRKFMDLPVDIEPVKRQLELDPDKKTVLITAGGQGIGKVYLFIEAITLLNLPLNVIVVSGKNPGTKKRMDKLVGLSKRTKIISLGYVTNMNELVASCDAVIGKAGASTAMESFFLNKPVVLTEWATYNDRYIINFVLDYKIGYYCPTLFSLGRVMKDIAEGNALESCVRNLAELRMKPGTDDVARFLARELGA
ncbi:MAG: hypothetical protein E4H20_00750 [Spirochaetales bacterium]|nr:MAG: hypothetical protein E4H20_00750 [Spirochaetales bacterium]